MKSKRLLASIAALGFALLGSTTTHAADLNVGDPSPAFKLVGSDGKTYTSEEFLGEQVVVIAWYPKAFTGG